MDKIDRDGIVFYILLVLFFLSLLAGAFVASFVLAVTAVIVLVISVRRKDEVWPTEED